MEAVITGIMPLSPQRQGEVGGLLRNTHQRFRNAIHACTRVYTCRKNRAPFELHWNDRLVPDESFIGEYGWAVPEELIGRIEAELMHGRAVRLFVFNSDADLCFQELLHRE